MKRLDDILGYKDLKIYQDSNFFSFSLDSIILANYCNINLRDKKIVDFCCGNGVVSLIVSKRCCSNIDSVEIQESLYDLAVESICYNNLSDRINVLCMDIKDFARKADNNSQYDLVLCNPPYFKNDENSTKNLSYEKMIARHEILLNLDELCNYFSELQSKYDMKYYNTFIYVTGIFRNLTLDRKQDLVKLFNDKFDLHFNIISHGIENYYLGKAMENDYNDKKVLIINMGGKTTELVTYSGNKITDTTNLTIGVADLLIWVVRRLN